MGAGFVVPRGSRRRLGWRSPGLPKRIAAKKIHEELRPGKPGPRPLDRAKITQRMARTAAIAVCCRPLEVEGAIRRRTSLPIYLNAPERPLYRYREEIRSMSVSSLTIQTLARPSKALDRRTPRLVSPRAPESRVVGVSRSRKSTLHVLRAAESLGPLPKASW